MKDSDFPDCLSKYRGLSVGRLMACNRREKRSSKGRGPGVVRGRGIEEDRSRRKKNRKITESGRSQEDSGSQPRRIHRVRNQRKGKGKGKRNINRMVPN